MRDLITFRNGVFDIMDQNWHRMLDTFFNPTNISSLKNSIKSSANYPRIDVFEKDEHYCVQAAVPGVKPENINIELFKEDSVNYLKISGSMSEEYQSKDDTDHRIKELRRGVFSRMVSLPDDLGEDEPIATIKDGLVTLKWKLPKPTPTSVERRVITLKTE